MRYGVDGDKTIPYYKHIVKISTKRGHRTAIKNELKIIANHGELLPLPLFPTIWGLGLWCLTPLSPIFQVYHGGPTI